MKTFKGWLNEATAQKASKDFETYIANLAVLSEKETSSIELKKLISNNKNKFKGLKTKDLSQVIDAVSKLNNFFKKKWTKGVNANFETGLHGGIYGKKSEAKADIILTADKKYGISIKKRGDIVVASSQDPDEFENIFWTAFKKCEKDKKIDTSTNVEWAEIMGNVENEVREMRDNVIGQTKSRMLDPDWFDKLKQGGKKETPEQKQLRKKFFGDFENFIETQNKSITEDYENTRKVIAKEGAKLINEKLGKSEILREYVIWEALSATLKYEKSLPAATHILSPSGCYDISKPNTKYVKAVAKASVINIRGMVHGSMRSSKEKAMKPVLKKLFAGETIDMAKLYDDVRKMDMSMKIDLAGKKRKEMENELDEGVVSDIWDKVKGWWISFKTTIQTGIELFKGKSNEVLDKMTELKQASFLDILRFNKPKISGTIKIP